MSGRRWGRSLSACMVVMACALAAPAPTNAQVQENTPRTELERRVRQAFQNRVRQDLALSAEEARRLARVIQWSGAERRAIAVDTRALNRRVLAFVRGGGTEDEARELLEGRADLQRREASLFEDEQRRLLEVLTPVQVVRFYRIRDEFNARVRRLRMQQGGSARDTTGELARRPPVGT